LGGDKGTFMRLVIIFGLICISAAGGSSVGLAADSVDQSATLEMERNRDSFRLPKNNSYAIYDNDRCENAIHTTQMGTIYSGKADVLRSPLRTGSPIYVRAMTLAFVQKAYGKEWLSCVRVIRFTPVAGHTYRISQTGDADSCSLAFADAATGTPPDDYSVVPTRWSCKPG
jgi:hypothetical protein